MGKNNYFLKTYATTPGCTNATTPSCICDTTPGCINATDNIIRAFNVKYFNFNNTKKTIGLLEKYAVVRFLENWQPKFEKKAVAAM